MGFLKKLFGGAGATPEKRYYTFNVKCNRCGEVIEGRVDLQLLRGREATPPPLPPSGEAHQPEPLRFRMS